MTKKLIDELEYAINGACIEVHKTLGQGLLESVYQKCLEREFELRGLLFVSQPIVIVGFKGISLDIILHADFLLMIV